MNGTKDDTEVQPKRSMESENREIVPGNLVKFTTTPKLGKIGLIAEKNLLNVEIRLERFMNITCI